MTETPNFTDLNDAFGRALIEKFFEPIPSGVSPDGQQNYIPSGVSMLANEIFRKYAQTIMDAVWEKLDLEDLCAKIADRVVSEIVKVPSYYQRNHYQEELSKRVMELVAQQLGQRVVDQMDLQISPKAIESSEE